MTISTERLNISQQTFKATAKVSEALEAAALNDAAAAISELLAVREAQPVVSGGNRWSCGKYFTYVQHSECDGYCPHCDSRVDLDEEDLDDEE